MKKLIQTLFFFLLVTQICFAQWYQQTSGTTRNLYGVSFYDLNNGIAVGDSGIILITTNGGTTWISPSSITNSNLNAVAYKSGNWVVVGSEGTIICNGVIQTSGTMNELFGVSFPDANYGTVVGDSGTILRTTDGGANWTSQTSGTTAVLYGVSFTDSDTGTAVGFGFNGSFYEYIILRTTNGGITWVTLSSGTGTDLRGVSFTDANIGTAIGNNLSGRTILKTINGGATWTEQSIPFFNYLYGISYTDANNGTVVGHNLAGEGIIFRTTNGGTTWTQQASGTTQGLGLWSVSFTDANYGTVVGDSGTVLHTTNGGVTFVEEEQKDEIPTVFLLSQNYPNPFNPTTSIQYAVSSRQFVTLKVYNLLGKEIETLVNEEKLTGTYEVKFDAANLPSGVYFYKLQAGNFVETKKMLLLK